MQPTDPVDMPAFRRHVRARILQELTHAGGATRTELMHGLVLSRTALTRVLDPMFAAGELHEEDVDAPRGRGRPARILRIRRPPVSTLAVLVRHDSLIAARVDEVGDVLDVVHVSVGASSEFDEALSAIRAAHKQLVDRAQNLPFDRCIVILPSIVHPSGTHVMASGARSIMRTWVGDTQRERIARAVSAPAWFANDGHLGALAEARFGSGRHSNSLLYVALSRNGIGGGLIINRELFLGGGHAGEISHVIVNPRGARCPCGRRGCVAAEVRASVSQLDTDHFRWDEVTAGVRQTLRRKIDDDIARALAGAINVIHPETVVISNDIEARLVGELVPRLADKISARAHPDIAARLTIVESIVSRDRMIGAAGLLALPPGAF